MPCRARFETQQSLSAQALTRHVLPTCACAITFCRGSLRVKRLCHACCGTRRPSRNGAAGTATCTPSPNHRITSSLGAGMSRKATYLCKLLNGTALLRVVVGPACLRRLRGRPRRRGGGRGNGPGVRRRKSVGIHRTARAAAAAAATAAAAAAAAAAAHPQPKSCAWSSEGPQRRSANGRGGQQRSVWRMSRRYLIVVIVTNNANK